MPLPAIFDVKTLDGVNGFGISGAGGNRAIGSSVSSAGDINGDGIEDFVVRVTPNPSNQFAGAYVVFGTQAGFPTNLDPATLSGANGFRITGQSFSFSAGFSPTGESAASAGDVNGDGIDDLIISDYRGNQVWVIFGRDMEAAGDFAAAMELSTLAPSAGFQLIGGFGENAGMSVSSAGDINHDGIDDIVIGSPDLNVSGPDRVYVVFGTRSTVNAPLDLSALDGTNGFMIEAEIDGNQTGQHVAALGDVNGDGIDDFGFGAPFNEGGLGEAYVVFGRNTLLSGEFDAVYTPEALANLRIVAEYPSGGSLSSISSAGDINGDGIEDFAVGAPYEEYGRGAVYVVFGKTTGLSGSLDVSSLNGANGFKIVGVSEEHAGALVRGGGDINGDGFDDLIISAPFSPYGSNRTGRVYVLFGQGGAQAPTIDLGALTAQTGMRIDGEFLYDAFGSSIGAADVNGDGFADIIVGAPYATRNGLRFSGEVYVIYGQPQAFVGDSSGQRYVGSTGADALNGVGGKDILYGMMGDDIIDGGADNDVLYGGVGADQLLGGIGNDNLFGDDGNDILSGGDGSDKLFGGAGADNLNGGTGNDRMAGEADIDTLRGGAGNDYLDGGIGADIMYGGADNDIYIVDDPNDQTIELANEGYDIVRTALTWALSDNIEALELQGSSNASGTGNSGANNLQGNSGNNTLSGLGGVDTINGNDGDDIIIGGAGNDLLRGGTGADIFRVEHAFSGALETDQIYDFSTAEGDIMDFQGAYSGTLPVVSAFTKHAGEMTLSFAAGITTVRLDIDGNGQPEYQVKINGDVTGDWGGWLL